MGVRFLGELYSRENVGVGDSEEEKPTLSYTEMFYQCLPHYLVMGMSADEFWNCDPRMYKVYREKDRLENERKNELLWMSGVYMTRALSSVISGDNPYPDKPFDIHGSEEEKEMSDERIHKTPQFIAVLDWMNKVNKQMRGENDGR